MTRPLPDWCFDIIYVAAVVGCLAWLTVLPSIGLLWLVGALS